MMTICVQAFGSYGENGKSNRTLHAEVLSAAFDDGHAEYMRTVIYTCADVVLMVRPWARRGPASGDSLKHLLIGRRHRRHLIGRMQLRGFSTPGSKSLNSGRGHLCASASRNLALQTDAFVYPWRELTLPGETYGHDVRPNSCCISPTQEEVVLGNRRPG